MFSIDADTLIVSCCLASNVSHLVSGSEITDVDGLTLHNDIPIVGLTDGSSFSYCQVKKISIDQRYSRIPTHPCMCISEVAKLDQNLGFE